MPTTNRTFVCAAMALLVASAPVKSNAASLNWSAADDHYNMMEQLGIRARRPNPRRR